MYTILREYLVPQEPLYHVKLDERRQIIYKIGMIKEIIFIYNRSWSQEVRNKHLTR